MTSILAKVRDAAAKRAAYHATVADLRRLPVDVAVEDLALYPGDAHAIASRVVYGR